MKKFRLVSVILMALVVIILIVPVATEAKVSVNCSSDPVEKIMQALILNLPSTTELIESDQEYVILISALKVEDNLYCVVADYMVVISDGVENYNIWLGGNTYLTYLDSFPKIAGDINQQADEEFKAAKLPQLFGNKQL